MGGSAGPAVDEAFWDASLSRSRRTMPGAALPSLLAWLAVLLLGRARPADACSCSPIHPQQAFCNADVGERFVPAGPRPAPHSPPTWGSAAQTSRWGRRAESWRGAEGRTDGRGCRTGPGRAPQHLHVCGPRGCVGVSAAGSGVCPPLPAHRRAPGPGTERGSSPASHGAGPGRGTSGGSGTVRGSAGSGRPRGSGALRFRSRSGALPEAAAWSAQPAAGPEQRRARSPPVCSLFPGISFPPSHFVRLGCC